GGGGMWGGCARFVTRTVAGRWGAATRPSTDVVGATRLTLWGHVFTSFQSCSNSCLRGGGNSSVRRNVESPISTERGGGHACGRSDVCHCCSRGRVWCCRGSEQYRSATFQRQCGSDGANTQHRREEPLRRRSPSRPSP